MSTSPFAAWENRFHAMKILPQRAAAVNHVASLIRGFKAGDYDQVSRETGVPWFVIGCIDALEGSFNHKTYLGNGEPLTHVTRKVPKGRGPFASWEAGAIDALKLQLRNMGIVKFDPSLGSCLHFLEMYNGAGYLHMGVPSPYLWSFSDQYHGGKFVELIGADGKYHSHYDSKLMSAQVGAACIIKALGVFDVRTAQAPLPAAA